MEEKANESNIKPDDQNESSSEIFLHPETGERISKNLYKKLIKGGPVKKEKKIKEVVSTEAGLEVNSVKLKKEKKAKESEPIFTDETPIGQFKSIENIFPQSYQPKYVESAWQSWWEKSGYFEPNVSEALMKGSEEKFVMVIPPPNVTGSLHLGHALTIAIEDCLTRWSRMKGRITVWVPGTDHAGIATQSVVEKRLKKLEGISRHDLGRDEFVKKVWDWKDTYGNRILSQIRFMGASVDFTREAFTMDTNLTRAVTEAFVRFHEDGLLYRDTRLINWSCALQSAISEIEVDYIDLEGRTFLSVPNHKLKDKYEFGMITSFAYKIDGSDTNDEIVVATTRLETMLGDTAVAVHPDDPRYKHLHGKYLKHPFVDRKIPIITDSELVDMNFGTGAVKVTPAHDPNDYNCGKRNNLEFIIVLTKDGRIESNGGKFAGMMRYDARIEVENELKNLGLLRGKEVNKMRLGLCSRSEDIIEPMLTPQWYVNCSSMAQRSVDAVRNGELKILPYMHEATWYRWLENIRDWCISRQLWWGHRIPAYFARLPGETEDQVGKNDQSFNNRWFVGRNIEDARINAAKGLNVPIAGITLQQDEDVLDTWFSSGLFPFSVFGWPNETADMKAFYPTTLLETGLDILFFWVARMVMMGLHLTDTLPFKTVYLHPMVRDKHGRKMSKSVGNVIDPLEVINGCSLEDLLRKIDEGNLPAKEVAHAKAAQTTDFPEGIPECGADALRFGLLAYTIQGRDVNLDIKRVVGYRQFCNKIWNACRFALMYIADFVPSPTTHLEILSHPSASIRDCYIISKLHGCIQECNLTLSGYLFGATTSALHSFFLYEVCDLHLELLKPVFTDKADETAGKRSVAQATLFTVLEYFLRLTHPIMPFITEELWQRLPNRKSLTTVPSITIASYPETIENWFQPSIESDMELVKETIHGARSLRADYKVPNHIKADFYFRTESIKIRDILTKQSDDFCCLAKGNFLQFLPSEQSNPKGCCIQIVSEQISLLVDLTGIIDINTELERLGKEVERLNPLVDSYKKKIAAVGYEEKVPESVRILNAEKLNGYELELESTLSALKAYQAMN